MSTKQFYCSNYSPKPFTKFMRPWSWYVSPFLKDTIAEFLRDWRTLPPACDFSSWEPSGLWYVFLQSATVED
eukprot:16452177-Heterocapsa_arctica.AAC.1